MVANVQILWRIASLLVRFGEGRSSIAAGTGRAGRRQRRGNGTGPIRHLWNVFVHAGRRGGASGIIAAGGAAVGAGGRDSLGGDPCRENQHRLKAVCAATFWRICFSAATAPNCPTIPRCSTW